MGIYILVCFGITAWVVSDSIKRTKLIAWGYAISSAFGLWSFTLPFYLARRKLLLNESRAQNYALSITKSFLILNSISSFLLILLFVYPNSGGKDSFLRLWISFWVVVVIIFIPILIAGIFYNKKFPVDNGENNLSPISNSNSVSSTTIQIARNGLVIGTYALSDIKNLILKGTILNTDHYWTNGMAGWKSVSEFSANEFNSANVSANSVTEITVDPSKHKFARTVWIIIAVFAPYIGCWRIIFDKSLGFAAETKRNFRIYLIIIMSIMCFGWVTALTSMGLESYEKGKLGAAIEKIMNSDSEEERRGGLEVVVSYAQKGDITAQCRLADIYKNGQINGVIDLVEAYAWYTVAATTHKVGERHIAEQISMQARDAQWELDEYERKRVVISRDKQIQLDMAIMRGYTPEHTVSTFDGTDDPSGGLANYIKSAKESITLLKKQMLQREIDKGEMRAGEIKSGLALN